MAFDFGTLTNSGEGDATLTFNYEVVVLNSEHNLDGTALSNSAVFSWDSTQLGPKSTVVNIVEPVLEITKTADTTFIGVGTDVTFTVTIQHAANSHTPAFDVVVDDPLPLVLDYKDGSLSCAGSSPAPTHCLFNPPVPAVNSGTIHVTWLDPNTFAAGSIGVIKFTVTGNATLVPGVPVTNTAAVDWTSLPGNGWGQQTGNIFSTERHYDPSDPLHINGYGRSAPFVLNPLGGGEGGGGCKRGGKNCFQIPVTGYGPGVFTDIGNPPAAAEYASTGVRLQIPTLKLNMGIVGVPLVGGVWQVDWLTGVGGWLQGTAFPGLTGNSVITSHVTTPYGSDGPFVHLNQMAAGDMIFIIAFGHTYIYEVKSVGDVAPDDITILKHASTPVLTLVTCDKWNAVTKVYEARIVVRAVLVEVTPNGR